MTARGAIVLLLVGFSVSILGALFKIQHWPHAGELLIASSLMMSIAIVILALKVSRYPGFNNFLDH